MSYIQHNSFNPVPAPEEIEGATGYLSALVAEMHNKPITSKRKIEAVMTIINGPIFHLSTFGVISLMDRLIEASEIDDNYYYLIKETLSFVSTGHRQLPLTIRLSMSTIDWKELTSKTQRKQFRPSVFSASEIAQHSKAFRSELSKYTQEEFLYQWLNKPTGFQDFVTFMHTLMTLFPIADKP